VRLTGTHIYSLLRCPHAVALDMHEDRDERRALTEIEEFVRQRGRDWEAEFVADLDYSEPVFARGDFADGAAQTREFLRDGVTGVTQGVLLEEGRLGIPDLLRREPGTSELGAYHYVVGDIKSSGRPRSDQLLQVLFYSRMLARLQGRDPEYGYLILKDGREERFVLADYAAAIEEVEQRTEALLADPTASRPFLCSGCSKCHWSEMCRPKLEAVNDLSLVQGMTRGLRTTLERVDCPDAAALRKLSVEPTARKSHLEPTLLRRLKKAAEARAVGRPLRQRRRRADTAGPTAVIHHLYDGFTERVLFFGVMSPATTDGEFFGLCPASREEELPGFLELVDRLPKKVKLLHYGSGLRRWFVEASLANGSRAAVEGRFVDLARRLRGAAIYQGPVFGMADHVRHALGTDPDREGEADAAALWAGRPEGSDWLQNKGRSDLLDLCGLVATLRDDAEEAQP